MVGAGPQLEAEVVSFFEAKEGVQVFCAPFFTPGAPQCDLIACSHESFSTIPADFSWKNHHMIVFGPSAFLRSAFLLGAQDYLKDPWTLDELWLRAKRITLAPRFYLNDTEFLIQGNILTSKGKNVVLSKAEILVINTLACDQGRPIPFEKLNRLLEVTPESRLLSVVVSSLRKKLLILGEASEVGNPILTIRGQGYLLPRFFLSMQKACVRVGE